MNLKLHYIETKEDFAQSERQRLSREVRKHARIAGQLLDIDLMTFSIYPTNRTRLIIPETAQGAYTASQEWIQLYLDPARFSTAIKNIPPAIYHEMHHAARMKTIGYGKTLLEAVVSEGLATIFEEETAENHNLEYKPLWAKYEQEEIDVNLQFFKLMMNREDYNHLEWFFGRHNKMPRWIGYKLGAYIIRQAKENTGKTALSLVNTHASEIYTMSRI